MGFLKRLFGFETAPGEPEAIHTDRFQAEVMQGDLPCIVEVYNLWCSSCQVMTGLLNELGPAYLGTARFFKVNAERDPGIAQSLQVSGVPTILFIKDGLVLDRLVGLVPLDILRDWIDQQISRSSGAPTGPDGDGNKDS